MARRQFETDLINLVRKVIKYLYPHSYFYKIPDDYKFKKPFDVFCSINDIKVSKKYYYAIEFKVHTKHTAWPLSDVESHQIEGLVDAFEGGYNSYIVLQVKYKTDTAKQNFIRVIPVHQFIEIKNSNKKSISVEDLYNNFEGCDTISFKKILKF